MISAVFTLIGNVIGRPIFSFIQFGSFTSAENWVSLLNADSPLRTERNDFHPLQYFGRSLLFLSVHLSMYLHLHTYSYSNNKIWTRSEWWWPLSDDFYFHLHLSTIWFDFAFCEWFCAFYCFRRQKHNRSDFINRTVLCMYASTVFKSVSQFCDAQHHEPILPNKIESNRFHLVRTQITNAQTNHHNGTFIFHG